LFIPMEISPKNPEAGLVMVGLKNGFPFYYTFPIKVIDDLMAFGDLDFIVVGIKNKSLQIIPREYEIVHDSKVLPHATIIDAFQAAAENRTTKPKKLFKHFNCNNKLHLFYGWKNAHKWVTGSDHLVRRIHVFYRPMREETPSARIRTSKNGVPLNHEQYKITKT